VKLGDGFYLKENDNRDLNEAILTGVLGFSFVFFSMKDLFDPDNKINFVALIFIYIFASICRIFGIILESEKINTISLHYCKIILIPFTVWAIIAIFFTEIGLFEIGSILSFYFLIFTEYHIVTKIYGIKFKFRSPIEINRDDEKFNEKN